MKISKTRRYGHTSHQKKIKIIERIEILLEVYVEKKVMLASSHKKVF